MSVPTLGKRAVAEGLGTLLLVYVGAGAAAITLMLARGTTPATPFNIGIGALGGLADWLAIGRSPRPRWRRRPWSDARRPRPGSR
jgi:hypothetical protein